MNDEQFKTICKKLDRISLAIAMQSFESKEDKISMLRRAGLTSMEVAPLVGITESSVRDSKGWMKK